MPDLRTYHFPYPPRFAVILDYAVGVGALVIERKGFIQVNYGPDVLFVAYRRLDVWVVPVAA